MSRAIAKQTAEPGWVYERAIGAYFDTGTLAQLPANGAIGWAPGCIYDARDQTAPWSNLYVNNGTFASANFQLLSSMAPTFTNIVMATNTGPNVFYFTDGTTKYLAFDTRNTTSGITNVTVTGNSPTIASAAGVTYTAFGIAAQNVNLTGTTTVTAMQGLGEYIGAPTVVGAAAVEVADASTLYVAMPVAGTNVTFGGANYTGPYSIHAAGNLLVDTAIFVGTVGSGSYPTYLANNTLNFTSGGAINATGVIALTAVAGAVSNFFSLTEGTASVVFIQCDSRTTVTGGGGTTLKAEACTFASAASAFTSPTVNLAAKTNTLTGTTTTTSWLGSALYVSAQTWTDSSACTLTTASAIHIVANAAAGGSLTITNSYMISTSVSGCFLTNAGTWTSASSAMHKEEVETALAADVFGVLDRIRPVSYRLKQEFRDFGRQRHGLIAEELPDELKAPGSTADDGLPDGITAAFAVACCKMLREESRLLQRENEDLKTRLDRVETLLGVR